MSILDETRSRAGHGCRRLQGGGVSRWLVPAGSIRDAQREHAVLRLLAEFIELFVLAVVVPNRRRRKRDIALRFADEPTHGGEGAPVPTAGIAFSPGPRRQRGRRRHREVLGPPLSLPRATGYRHQEFDEGAILLSCVGDDRQALRLRKLYDISAIRARRARSENLTGFSSRIEDCRAVRPFIGKQADMRGPDRCRDDRALPGRFVRDMRRVVLAGDHGHHPVADLHAGLHIFADLVDNPCRVHTGNIRRGQLLLGTRSVAGHCIRRVHRGGKDLNPNLTRPHAPPAHPHVETSTALSSIRLRA